jgi:hypothetical protein
MFKIQINIKIVKEEIKIFLIFKEFFNKIIISNSIKEIKIKIEFKLENHFIHKISIILDKHQIEKKISKIIDNQYNK